MDFDFDLAFFTPGETQVRAGSLRVMLNACFAAFSAMETDRRAAFRAAFWVRLIERFRDLSARSALARFCAHETLQEDFLGEGAFTGDAGFTELALAAGLADEAFAGLGEVDKESLNNTGDEVLKQLWWHWLKATLRD